MINLVFKYKLSILASVSLFVVIGVPQSIKNDNKSMEKCGKCNYWQAKVDPSIKLPKNVDIEKQKDSTVELLPFKFNISEEDAAKLNEATECFLKLKGNISSSNFTTLFGIRHSSRLPPPTVEVAALYYISALYYKKWKHADGIILIDKHGNSNSKESIENAYQAYKTWFEKVKKLGFEEARKQNLSL